MNNNKKQLLFILITMILVFWGCGDRGALDVKTVKASRFTDLVFDGDALTPGQGFNWQMGTEDFLSKVYGADTMKPGSESFNEYRYFYSEEMGVTTFTPPVSCQVKGIPGKADVMYAFDRDGLYQAGYSWIFQADEGEKARQAVRALVEDLDSSEKLTPLSPQIPDLEDEEAFPCTFIWPCTDPCGGELKLLVSRLKGAFILQILAER